MPNTFPSLSKSPVEVKVIPRDDTIMLETDGGYTLARARNSRAIVDFEVSYIFPVADRDSLISFVDGTVYGAAGIFNWTYPNFTGDAYAGDTFSVRFEKKPTYEPVKGTPWWKTTFTLKGV